MTPTWFWWERPPPHAPTLLYSGYLPVMMCCVLSHKVAIYNDSFANILYHCFPSLCDCFVECGDPSHLLRGNVSVTSLKRSIIALSCDDGYSLNGSNTSECINGQWIPSIQLAMCIMTKSLSSQILFISYSCYGIIMFCSLKGCVFPSKEFLQHNIHVWGNITTLTFSCKPDGTHISRCMSGEWIPSPDSVTCRKTSMQ